MNSTYLQAYPRACRNTLAPVELSYFSLVVCFILFVCIVPGNIMVCLAVLWNPHRNLRSHFTLLIANLAMADLIAGLVTEPCGFAYVFLEVQGHSPPVSLVYLTHLSYFISVQASVLTLVGLTSDRYLAITKPLWYRANVSPANATLLSGLVWACAIGFSFIYLHVGFALYSFIFANTAVIFALIIMTFTYVRLLKAIRARVDEVLTLDAGTPNKDKQKREALWEKKLTKTYLLMLICFLACYVPSCVLIYVQHFCTICSCEAIHWLRDFQFNLVLLSSAINPFIYAWRLSNFRRVFVIIIKCNVCTLFHASSGRGNVRVDSIHKNDENVEVIAMTPMLNCPCNGCSNNEEDTA